MAYPTIRPFESSRLELPIGKMTDINSPGKTNILTFTRNSGKYMFTNYPEGFGRETGKNLAFTDNGYYINKASFGEGECQIFYSHNNFLDESIRYGVYVWNPSQKNYVTVTRQKFECSSGWESVVPMRDFLKNNDEIMRTLAPHEGWVINKPKGSSLGDHGVGPKSDLNGRPFHGIIRLYTSGLIQITCYAYKTLGGYAGSEVCFPLPSERPDLATATECVSGLGEGYILNTTINLEIGGNLTAAAPYIYRTSFTENKNDITPIIQVQDGEFHPFRMCGNYTAEYNFTVNITNSTDMAQTVYGFTSSNTGRPCIRSGQDVQGNLIEEKSPKDPPGTIKHATWRWFEETIPANSTQTFTYTMANGSYGDAALIHAFSLHRNLV